MIRCTSCSSTFSDAPFCPFCNMPQALLDTDPIDPLVSIIDLPGEPEPIEPVVVETPPPLPEIPPPWQPPAPPVRRRRRRRWLVPLALAGGVAIGVAVANGQHPAASSTGVQGGGAIQAATTTTATPTVAPTIAYRTVHGVAKGFSAQVPATFHELSSTGSMTRTWVSPDGQTKVALSSAANHKALSPPHELAALVAAAARRHEVVTLKAVKGTVVVASGTVAGSVKRVYYVREIVGKKTVYTLTWTYPYDQKSLYAKTFVHSVSSMRPGAL